MTSLELTTNSRAAVELALTRVQCHFGPNRVSFRTHPQLRDRVIIGEPCVPAGYPGTKLLVSIRTRSRTASRCLVEQHALVKATKSKDVWCSRMPGTHSRRRGTERQPRGTGTPCFFAGCSSVLHWQLGREEMKVGETKRNKA